MSYERRFRSRRAGGSDGIVMSGAAYRVTTAGKIAITVAATLILCLVVTVFGPVSKAESSETPQQVAVYQVQPGDTLWGYATQITPANADVRQTVDDIMELNDLRNPQLYVGQRLLVPVEEAQ